VKLPNGDRADLGTKLIDYVLNPEHRQGRHKARVFESSLGISRENQQLLEMRCAKQPLTRRMQYQWAIKDSAKPLKSDFRSRPTKAKRQS
jgi:hypothetical protein